MIKQHSCSIPVVLFFLMLFSFHAYAGNKKKVNVGDQAPAFTVTDINGQTIALEQLKGKVVVLNFWFIHCAPCREEMPVLNKLVEQYKGNENIVFIGLTADNSKRVKKFLADNPFLFQIVPGAHSIEKEYDISGHPSNIIINKTGKIVLWQTGYGKGTETYIEETIERALHK